MNDAYRTPSAADPYETSLAEKILIIRERDAEIAELRDALAKGVAIIEVLQEEKAKRSTGSYYLRLSLTGFLGIVLGAQGIAYAAYEVTRPYGTAVIDISSTALIIVSLLVAVRSITVWTELPADKK